MKKRLLPDIVSITPTNYDDFVQCERRSTSICSAFPRATRVHRTRPGCSRTTCCASFTGADLVATRRMSPTCSPATPPTTITSASSSSATRSAARRTKAATGGARTSKRWRASTVNRSRCSWRPLASTRSGCTTASSTPRLQNRPALARARRRRARGQGPGVRARRGRAQARAATAPPLRVPERRRDRGSRRLGARSRRHVAIEEAIRSVVERMRGNEWKGVADAALCSHCSYRSICRDSAARGEPTWPVLATEASDPPRIGPPWNPRFG